MEMTAQKMSVTGIVSVRAGNSLIAQQRLRKLKMRPEGHVAFPAEEGAVTLRHDRQLCRKYGDGLERV
ncbi:hypothetical protein [Celeribacter sp. PS-C1]|uniref:hypothetical protein n=1 Tax=Celeribacter sp. PS-C1 TaxID=2820813 RepID=UPI001CA54E81|nr:hypothetical protein [Celeribacter sp. PS-C1]